MLKDSNVNRDVKKDDIVYDLCYYDYGLSNDDTRLFGIKYISVTLNENGYYPFFTVPLCDLKVVRD